MNKFHYIKLDLTQGASDCGGGGGGGGWKGGNPGGGGGAKPVPGFCHGGTAGAAEEMKELSEKERFAQ